MSVQFDLPKIGRVEMVGTGPWKIREHGAHSFSIIDAEQKVANPTVTNTARGGRGTKTNQNVAFAQRTDADLIVATANLKLAEA
jgi:hypothetical protein